MARALWGFAGGIKRLDSLIEEYTQAIESDLIDRGLRLRQLGSKVLSWRDLSSIIANLKPDSALVRQLSPDTWRWQLNEHLLANIADSLRWLRWAKTEDGRRGRNVPQPIPRPGIEPERIGDTHMSIADMDKFLGWEVKS
ncbi:Ner family transcriptional regulator [Nocardia amikacinitolerans]|uniref:Ner family transcriptional regulator n=1 Tax=Nocardia amikacinitolerans TaxID=756689 RepID=A0A285LGC3_9NOCA|nr:DUF5361 domain-containing protein [Nocardia amikacinitolerans]SNY84008.1 Ner family transcriptional regulator [Nocardia amikacinitolerans]